MVKLHKVTVFVVDTGHGEDPVEELKHYCYHDVHRSFTARVTEVKTVEFPREWDDGDPLNQKDVLSDSTLLESMVKG